MAAMAAVVEVPAAAIEIAIRRSVSAATVASEEGGVVVTTVWEVSVATEVSAAAGEVHEACQA